MRKVINRMKLFSSGNFSVHLRTSHFKFPFSNLSATRTVSFDHIGVRKKIDGKSS